MAWEAQGTNITMAEGDYGVSLPFIVKGVTFTNNDSIGFVVKSVTGDELINKVFSSNASNKVNIYFTEEESAKLPAGTYRYRLDWYQDGAFMDNIIKMGALRVVNKA